GREQGGRFHVDGHAAHQPQLFLERLVVFPDPPVGGVDGAGPVIVTEVADRGGDRTLKRERRQRGHFRRQVVAGGALAADRRNGKDQVAQLVLALEPAALAQE